jgi:hypothetical protein
MPRDDSIRVAEPEVGLHENVHSLEKFRTYIFDHEIYYYPENKAISFTKLAL